MDKCCVATTFIEGVRRSANTEYLLLHMVSCTLISWRLNTVFILIVKQKLVYVLVSLLIKTVFNEHLAGSQSHQPRWGIRLNGLSWWDWAAAVSLCMKLFIVFVTIFLNGPSSPNPLRLVRRKAPLLLPFQEILVFWCLALLSVARLLPWTPPSIWEHHFLLKGIFYLYPSLL